MRYHYFLFLSREIATLLSPLPCGGGLGVGSFAFESQVRQTTSSNANIPVIARLDEVKSWQSISLLWIATLAKAILTMTA